MTPSTRALWLCKARYMNHDVIEDRYARLFELPHLLGGHMHVVAFCLDYRLQAKQPVAADLKDRWYRYNVPRSLFIGWFIALMLRARRLRPQVVIASSDCLHVILGAFVAAVFKSVFVVDLYDDYAQFGLAKIPGVRYLYNLALARADGICAVSKTLGSHMEQQYPGKPVLLLESTIDSALFYPRDKTISRAQLGLDQYAGKKLVGICGGLNAFHGADIVFEAMAGISKQRGDVVFVVAGRIDDECPLPEGDHVAYIGMLPHTQMPYFFSAMDVAIVALSNTPFGYFAFPQKAYEVLSCAVPVAAANVGALAMLFENAKELRYDPDSSDSLTEVVVRQLERAVRSEVNIPTWGDQARALAGFIDGLDSKQSV